MSTFKLNSFLRKNVHIVTPHSFNIFRAALLSCAVNSTVSHAEEVLNDSAIQLPVINVSAEKENQDPLKLKEVNTTASQLGLTAKEMPATLQTITQKEIKEKGIRTTKEAFSEITGATVGNVPGNPAVLTARGFSGNTNSVLYDGIRLGASTFTTRDSDVWKYEKIEVLKGPSSVLYGEGSLGVAVNLITKKPTLDHYSAEGLLSYGSFNTVRAAIGGNLPINDQWAVRSDISYMNSDSLYDIDNQNTTNLSLSSSALFKPNQDLSMIFALAYDHDKSESSYHGSPLLPASVARDPSDILSSSQGWVIDKSIRHTNYSPHGARNGADSISATWTTDYQINPIWKLKNITTYFQADRDFFLASEQDYNVGTGLFDRTVEAWTHDHKVLSNRLSISSDNFIADKFRNRFGIGGEYSRTDFYSSRPTGVLTSVDPFNPDVGNMPSVDGSVWPSFNLFDTKIDTVAVFAENAFNITPEWLVIGGVRYESIDVDRYIYNVNTGAEQSFNADYKPFSWRLGSVYNVTPDIQLYGQYSTAVTPLSSLVVISTANGRFNLSKGNSIELGFKSSLFNGKTDIVGSIYQITLDDILTRDPNNFSVSVQGGEQQSQGIELSASSQLTPQLRLNTGLSFVDAEYKTLIDGSGVNRSGNRPINVPKRGINASLSYTLPNQPLILNAYVKHADGFYTDTANTILVDGHTVFDASINYQLNDAISLTLWGKNLSNEFYAEYSGYSSRQVYIAPSRTVELGLNFKF